MKAERIAELRALAEKATPGPWFTEDRYPGAIGEMRLCYMEAADARFIAAARTALPEALDMIEWIRGQLNLWLDYEETKVSLASTARYFLAVLDGVSNEELKP